MAIFPVNGLFQRDARPAPWKSSILAGSIFAVIVVAILVSMGFIASTAWLTEHRARAQVMGRLDELVQSAEKVAGIACFTNDPTLARETARALVLSSDVYSVVITSEGRELVRQTRAGVLPPPPDAVTAGRIRRTLYSPFTPPLAVGEIQVDANFQSIRITANEEIRFVSMLLSLLTAATIAAVAGVVTVLVVRPVKSMSDQLHVMEAQLGERLPLPKGHEHSELGRLVADINGLAGRMDAALRHEHDLRMQREVDERKYRAIFENVEAGIFIVDAEFRLASYNAAFERQMQLLPGGQDGPVRFITESPWRDRIGLENMLFRCIAGNTSQAADFEFVQAAGTARWFHLILRPVGGGLAQGMANDVTEQRRSENAARMALLTDELTGMANRAGLEVALHAEEGKGRSTRAMALILVDLDGFRSINNAMGLPVGDEILRSVARRIRKCLAPESLVARLGGDEFAVLLSGDRAAALRLGNDLVRALDFRFEVDDSPLRIGASVGVALFPVDAADSPSLLRNAQLALDEARAEGGRRLRFFDAAMVESAESRRRLETDIQLAISRDELRLFLQPIVDIENRRMAGAEGLLRWNHPKLGLVPPDIFIPVAEKSGYIREIGAWVVEAACEQLARWKAEGRDWYLSINVSGRQVPDGLPVEGLVESLRRHGVPASRLALEITEGVFINDEPQARDWLIDVRRQGLRIYLDDFGTGYSSLSYLKRFPVDVVKVDKSFVRDMGEVESDRKLVQAVIAMAHSLNMEVVAEGVETEKQFQLLAELGCGYVQGEYFSCPVPAESFAELALRVGDQLELVL